MFEQLRRWRLGKQYGYEVLFKGQDRLPVGKPGVILAELGMPEDYDPEFYIRYMGHVFQYVLPPFVRRFVLADRGIVLIDPQNPLAREPFEPRQLIDMYGSFANGEGRPYTECQVTWCPPGMKQNPWDHGHFLYTGHGKGGAPDICQKAGAKVVGWYYGHLLPERKVAWAHQCRRIYEEATARLRQRLPQAEFRHARYGYPESVGQAVEALLAAGCQTIVYQDFSSPAHSDFEQYAYALPMVHEFVNGRAKVICADQLGNQPAMREAYVQIIRDQLATLPRESRLLLILSKHGHPFKKETLDLRGPEYQRPLEAEARRVMAAWGGQWDLVWSDDEYADEYWDPKGTKLATFAAYRRAIEEAYDYALEVPTDFVAENTDLMILHAMRKFCAFAEYDPYEPIPYPDWEQPLVRTFRERTTTGIYAGCPVGPYRKHVVEATVSSVLETLHVEQQ
jgi:protoheme ferro-lyase